jgi:hypothetical protein
MSQTVIPDSHTNRLGFLKALKTQIAANATAAGLDTATVTGYSAILDPLIAKYQALVDAEEALTTANADAAQAFRQGQKSLQGMVNELKNNTKVTAGMRSEMGIAIVSGTRDPNTTKPRIKAVAQAGHVTLTGSKDYAELINIYMRVVGTAEWTLIGVRRKRFPFEDQTPLKTAGTPEQREYQARGVMGDEEVGQPSDIVSVLYGG